MEGSRVFVRVIGKTIPRKELEIYFQSREQSGGGTIASLEQINDEGSIITFKDQEVARNVTSRTHTVNGARVEVSCYPFTGDDSGAPPNQSNVVIIRGLSANTTEDALSNYLENTRRSGGGEVEEVKITGNTARVKFESCEVANRVVQHEKHVLNGATLEVSIEIYDIRNDAQKTIQVTGLAAETTKDSILNYFENSRRSGGGEVESVDLRNGKGVAFLTFVDASVARNVTSRTHTVNGARVEVSCYPFMGDDSGAPPNQSNVVIIRGLSANTTEDALSNYLENTGRSGGGEVEEVKITGNTARVKFESCEVANRVVQHEKHVLNGATLEVSIEIYDIRNDAQKTIQVTGLAAETTKDSILNYFENSRRSGGGEVESVDLRNGKGVAFLTFVDASVARNVTSRTHTVNGARVEVSCYPFTGDDSGAPPNQSNVVIIRGLSANTTEDALSNYLENTRRSGGGEVEEVKITGNTARVKFESCEVANRVVQHEKHVLNGATLEVSIEIYDIRNDAQKTIQVTGLAAETTKDSILNYFENSRRSGGGEVESVDLRNGKGVAFLTFVDASVVTSVLKREKHFLDGATLHVSITQDNSTSPLTPLEDIQELRTIEVAGISLKTTEDSIRNFFENTRRSGGGDIENIELYAGKGVAVVTFLSAESAQGVLNKGNITLDDAELKVTLQKPMAKPSTDNMRLLVKGLSEKTTRDGIASYMEVVSGLDVTEIQFGEPGCVLVTFAEEYDFEPIAKKLMKRNLDGNVLALEKVSVCHCVQVTGLNRESTTEDAVLYHFENPKNGGGDVHKVETHITQGWALVHFEDPQVVTNVVAKRHVLNGAQLEVRPHIPAFSKSVSPPHEQENEMKQEISVDPELMLFISEQRQVELERLKDKHDVKISWEGGSKSVTLTNKDKALRDKHQFEQAIEAIASYFDAFVRTTTPVIPDTWQDVVQYFQDSGNSEKTKVKIEYLSQQCEIVLTGTREDVEALTEELHTLKAKVEKERAFEAAKTSQTIQEIPPMHLKFLRELDFDKELEAQYENVEIEIILDKGEVQINGPREIVHKTAAAFWEAVAKMKGVNLEVSQNVVEVLKRNECQSFIRNQFIANNLQAALSFNDEDQTLEKVVVMGMNSESTAKAAHIVKMLVTEESMVLDEGQVQLEKSEKWRLLKGELTEKNILSVTFDQTNSELRLAGRRKDISSAVKSIERFFEENTIVSKEVEIPKGCRRFLVKYREQELRQIQEQLNKFSTVIKGMEGDHDEQVAVSGTTDGVSRGVKMIEDLASNTESQRVPINKPGMRKTLAREKGMKILALLENEHKCIIEHFNDPKDVSVKDILERENDEVKKVKKQCECSILTKEGKNISVFKDSICDRNVDIIVNAANSKLQHSSGLSKQIVDAGGETMQDECDQFIADHGSILEGQVVVTSAGKMSFRKVIHAVGPFWRKEAGREKSMGKTPREEKLLRYAVSNALDAASEFTSVALPAIGTGACGCPREVCANVMVDAVLTFCDENPVCRLSEIQFAGTDDAVVAAFVNEMNARARQDPKLQLSSKASGSPKVMGIGRRKSKGTAKPIDFPTPASRGDPDVITTTEGLKLVLVAGDMTREQVDAIVNSTSSNLDLSRNASAQALSNAAGPKLQQECTAIGQVQTGGIVVTSGGNLGCKHVFHTSCAEWENGKGEKVLRDIIKKSLCEAQKRSLSSIAIPAIGTGNLKFPHDRVALASLDEVIAFSKKNPTSSVKEVHLVVYTKDLSSVQAFQSELRCRKRDQTYPPMPATAGSKKGPKSRRAAAKRSASNISLGIDDDFEHVIEELDPLKPEITIGGITVQAETGDITKEATDAIVTLSNTNLDVAHGDGVGKAIISAGGPSIQAECSYLGIQPRGAIVVTKAGMLQTSSIYHIVPEQDKPPMASLKDSIVKCLKRADMQGRTSISFPAIGTGNMGVDAKESSEEMLAAIAKFAQEPSTSLNFIRIVIYQEQMFHDYRNAMEECISLAGSGPSVLSKIVGWFGFGKSSSPSLYSAASKKRKGQEGGSYLEVFAGSKQEIKKAVEEILKDLTNSCIIKVIEEEAIGKLSKEQTKKIEDLGESNDTSVIIEEKVGRISIRGDAEDVVDVASSIYEILNQHIEKEHTRGFEEFMSKNIQWSFYEDDSLVPYDASHNFRIERAFSDGQKSVVVLIDDNRYEIVFKDMKETCLDDGEETDVVRKEVGKGVPLPDEWSMQPKDSTGKEKEVHLVELNPINNATEYSKVVDEIKKTASVTITKIERVQNPGLYRAYLVKRDQMDQKNGSNEKFLFHGTAKGSCSSINTFGFNRSYCGKNATVYGNGVYFARDAIYSTNAKYSPPDPSGNRYLYLARVLVGEYAVGRQGMITPPAKGSDATDAYDSVVDRTTGPSIFVVFYDTQCYPDYLVTFK